MIFWTDLSVTLLFSLCFSGFAPNNTSLSPKRSGPIQGQIFTPIISQDTTWKAMPQLWIYSQDVETQHHAAACPTLPSSQKQWKFTIRAHKLQGMLIILPQVQSLYHKLLETKSRALLQNCHIISIWLHDATNAMCYFIVSALHLKM